VFHELDSDGTGTVPVHVLRHLLSEVSVESVLSPEETAELLADTGVTTRDGPYLGLGTSVDYTKFVKGLLL
jgi:hypothetical protein